MTTAPRLRAEKYSFSDVDHFLFSAAAIHILFRTWTQFVTVATT